MTVCPCSAVVVCRLRVSASGSGTVVSIAEIQTHVQQLVVQKHISFNTDFKCFTGSTLI